MSSHPLHCSATSIVRYESTSPNGSSHCPQASDFVMRRNIIIPFDGSLDWRFRFVVDALPKHLRKRIRLMQKNTDGLWIAWNLASHEAYLAWVGEEGVVSGGVRFGKRGVRVCGDWWAVYHTDIYGKPLPGQL